MSRFPAEPWIVDFMGSPAGSSQCLSSKTPAGSTRQPRWRFIEQFQETGCGSTRPQAFTEAASRSPAVVGSSTALAFNEADVARGD